MEMMGAWHPATRAGSFSHSIGVAAPHDVQVKEARQKINLIWTHLTKFTRQH